MKKQYYMLGALCLTFLFAACGGSEDESKDADGEKGEKCFYSVNTDSYELNWTAFKTTSKVPVGGTFSDVNMTAGESEDIEGALTTVEFEISTASVETQNEERNGKIAEHFFGTINTPTITGNLSSVDIEGGTAVVTIMMNGISFDVEGDFAMDGENFTYKADIDVQKWNAVSGIAALNTICEDLHTGDDGISVLWQNVDISFAGSLNKDCQ